MNSRSLRTRQLLVNAGLTLLAKRPASAVAIDEIVATAGVAKGSFFNHFEDKERFATSISTMIRLEVEKAVVEANREVADPLRRLVGGMSATVDYALKNPQKAGIMLREARLTTGKDHPLNKELRRDIDGAINEGCLFKEAETSGVLLWLSACNAIVAHVVEYKLSRKKAAQGMREIMFMALVGLGVKEATAMELSEHSHTALVQNAP